MPLVPFVAGQKPTAAVFNAAHDIIRTIHQTSDQSVTSSTVLVSSTSLVLSVKASALYVFESQIFYSGSTIGDFKMNLLLPTGTTVRWADSTGTTSSTSTTRAYSAVGSASVSSEAPRGVIDTDTTSGNLTIQFAQNTSDVTATTLRTLSWIRLTQIA